MTARIDLFVKAHKAVVLPSTLPGVAPRSPDARAGAQQERERAERQRDLEERVQRWKEITEAGGVDAWLKAQLLKKGFSADAADPASLTDRQRAQFKAQKKAEAEERRALRKLAYAAQRATHIGHLGAGVYWTDDPDADRFDIQHRAERARDNGLPELAGPGELAQALGLSVSRLRWLTYHRDADSGSHYHRFLIPKRDGSPRLITAPKKYMKDAQRWVLRQVAEKLPVHGAAHGFLPSRSVVTNATVHVGAHTLVKLDIEDFFPTVTVRRVRGLLRKAGLSEQVATLLSQLCTEAPREPVQFRGKLLHVATGARALPQGAPTSPALTNALCLRLDKRLSGLARSLGFRYTRYADDLTFSWHLPTGAAREAAGPHPRAPVGALLKGAGAIIEAEGFRVHPKKTKVVRAGERQRVTGLVVNQSPLGPVARVPRETLRRLRAALHNREQGKPGKEGETLEQLRGMAAFVYMTDPQKGRALLDRIAALK